MTNWPASTGCPRSWSRRLHREVAEIMNYASANRIPVTPRGQGTGLVGAAVATQGGIMLSLSRMNRSWNWTRRT